MASHIALTVTFGDTAPNNIVTAGGLHALVSSALVTAIPIDEFQADTTGTTAAGAKLIRRTTAEVATGQGNTQASGLWFDETNDDYRQQNATTYDSVIYGPSLANDTGDTIPKGMVVRAGASNTMVPTHDNVRTDVAGIVIAATNDGTNGRLQKIGLVEVLLEVPFSRGDHLITSTAITGAALSSTFLSGSGNFTAGKSFGMCLSNHTSGTTALATCLVFI